MKLPLMAFNDRVKVTKKDGRTFDSVPALVQRGQVQFANTDVPIDDGDRIERALPGNSVERLVVTDAGYTRGIAGLADFYLSSVRREGDVAAERGNPQQTTINVTGDLSRINVNSIDASSNVVTVETTTVFKSMRDSLNNANIDSTIREALLKHINAMEAESSSPLLAKRYAEFMSAAADHLQVFSAFLPALSQIVLRALGS
jgi:hypothetical protein